MYWPFQSFYGSCANGRDQHPVAVGPLHEVNEYFSTQTIHYSDGTSIARQMIKGPPAPPPGYELQRKPVSLPANVRNAAKTLTVPAFKWVFGCSAVSGAMIAGYYDRNGYPNLYTGPTGGGVMPLTEDASWGTWSDGHSTYPNNPLIASHNGLDGRSTKGSIDDYWVQYNSAADDPYITGSWTQHCMGSRDRRLYENQSVRPRQYRRLEPRSTAIPPALRNLPAQPWKATR